MKNVSSNSSTRSGATPVVNCRIAFKDSTGNLINCTEADEHAQSTLLDAVIKSWEANFAEPFQYHGFQVEAPYENVFPKSLKGIQEVYSPDLDNYEGKPLVVNLAVDANISPKKRRDCIDWLQQWSSFIQQNILAAIAPSSLQATPVLYQIQVSVQTIQTTTTTFDPNTPAG